MDERRVCVVLYKDVGGAYRYAVLKRTKNWEGWELVKGHLEGDDPAAAARQEVAEEAGIDDLRSLDPLDVDMGWTYEDDSGETVDVACDCFIAEAPEDAVVDTTDNPDEEHEHGFFLNFRDATDILHFDNQRELLEKADAVLTGDD